MKSKRWKLLLIGILFIAMNINFSRISFSDRSGGMSYIICSDAAGYYEYLPYLFIKKDILHQHYAFPLDNGKTINKYTMGVAVLQLPFFLAAHCIALIFQLQPTGYSNIYGYGIAFATSFYVFLGLLFMFKLLAKIFDANTAMLSIIILYFGSNLFYYSTMEPGMSHAYSFFCFSGFLFFLEKLFKQHTPALCIFVACFLSFAILIKFTNIFIALLLPLYHVYSWQDLKKRIFGFFEKPRLLFILLLCPLIFLAPQIYYWYKASDQLVLFSYSYSYVSETFSNWRNPKILEVLFGVQCGWFPYTPIMIFSIPGLFLTLSGRKFHAPAIVLIFTFVLYACSSWWAYSLKCAFGFRGFIEYYALLIIPIACFINSLAQKKNKKIKILVVFFSVLLIFINIKMSLFDFSMSWCAPDWTWVDYFGVIKKLVSFNFL